MATRPEIPISCKSQAGSRPGLATSVLSWVGSDAAPPLDRAVIPAAGDAKGGGVGGAGSRAGVLIKPLPMPVAAGKHLPIVLLPAMPSASEARLALAEHWQRFEACCNFLIFFSFYVFFLNGVGFSFCLSKAGNKTRAIMVFVFVSALHPHQWLLKLGRGYMSESYTHSCTFHENK